MDLEEFTESPGTFDEFDGLPCYRPPSLPPELSFTDDLLRVYGDAQYALGRLATLHRDLENPNLLIAPFVHREAAMSSQVEGTNVTISDIYQHEVGATPERTAAADTDVREAYNYVDAVTQGFARLDSGDRIDIELVCDLHEQLMDDVRGGEDRPGDLRNVPVSIGARGADPAEATFIPASPEYVEVLLEQLITYIRRGDYPALIDVALAHYQFEAIHPFRDGNGRIGRLIIMLQLYHEGLLPGPYLYLSAYFRQYGQGYRDRLLAVSTEGAWENWIVFVLNAIAEQAIDAYDCGIRLKDLRTTYLDLFPSAPTVRDLIDYLFEQPYLTAPRAIEATGRSKPAIYDAIATLEAEDIIVETTGKQRNKVYEAPELLSVLSS